MEVVRVFTGPDGQSHFEDVDIDLDDHGMAGRISALWPGAGVQFREVDGDYHARLPHRARAASSSST